MTNQKIFFIVIILSCSTIILRIFPLFIKVDTSSPKVRTFFKALPFAALSSLIFPDILTSTGSVVTSAIGASIAFILAYKKINLGLNILISVLSVYLISLFI
jgi:branched-subunit amino acid transport protein